jgi:flagellar hook-length control protein FliK
MEKILDTQAKTIQPSAGVENAQTGGTTADKGEGANYPNAPAPSSASANQAASLPLAASSPAPSPETNPQTKPTAEPAASPVTGVSTNAAGGAPLASSPDAGANGQSKSVPPSAQVSASNLPPTPNPVTSTVTTAVADPSAGLAASQPTNPTPGYTGNTTPQSAPSSSQPSATLTAWQGYEGGAGSLVRSAQLNQISSGSEMHVELHSVSLGNVEVRAVVNENTVGAEIHVQGEAAHTLLAAGLPALEHALGERNMRVQNISLYQDAAGGMSGGENPNQHSGSYPTPHSQAPAWSSSPPSSDAPSASWEEQDSDTPATGLSVRA